MSNANSVEEINRQGRERESDQCEGGKCARAAMESAQHVNLREIQPDHNEEIIREMSSHAGEKAFACKEEKAEHQPET